MFNDARSWRNATGRRASYWVEPTRVELPKRTLCCHLIRTFASNWNQIIWYYPFAIQVKKLYLFIIKPVIISSEAFVQNVLVPKIIVKHEMEWLNCSYKLVSRNLFARDLPTEYYEKILLQVSKVLNFCSRRPASQSIF